LFFEFSLASVQELLLRALCLTMQGFCLVRAKNLFQYLLTFASVFRSFTHYLTRQMPPDAPS